ncbi:unnamed protein product, partial [Pylaiella littoralis]
MAASLVRLQARVQRDDGDGKGLTTVWNDSLHVPDAGSPAAMYFPCHQR